MALEYLQTVSLSSLEDCKGKIIMQVMVAIVLQ